jgi:hypothetical protein
MKKSPKKLQLHRETLRSLNRDQLHQLAGGGWTDPSDCIGCVPTNYECVSYDIVCPDTGGPSVYC